MNISITLSKKEITQAYQILKAFDEGLIVNPSEEWELDHYDEKIADRNGLKPIIKKIEQSLPKKESEKTKKTILRRRYATFNNEINESVYKKIENAFNIMAKRNVEKIFSELGHSKDYVANKPFLESLKEDDLELGTVLKDRYNLDQQVLIPIGFTNEDILNVYRTLSSLVKNRLIKAITM